MVSQIFNSAAKLGFVSGDFFYFWYHGKITMKPPFWVIISVFFQASEVKQIQIQGVVSLIIFPKVSAHKTPSGFPTNLFSMILKSWMKFILAKRPKNFTTTNCFSKSH